MMKKVMFLVVMLLVATTCFAQLQSGPSNVVGYVKIVATGATPGVASATAFGLPFKFWDVPVGGIPTYGVVSTNPSDICGDQTNCGTGTSADRITRQDLGAFAYRSSASSCAWTGSLETGSGMIPGHAFWYLNKTGANRNFVLAGEVDNSGNYGTVNVAAAPASTPYSWRDSRSVNRDDLNLVASGFTAGTATTSDRVTQQGGLSAFFWRRASDNTWQGTLVTVEPGTAYWIKNNHATTWNYTYDASGATLTVGVDNKFENSGGSISKIISTPKAKVGKTAGRD